MHWQGVLARMKQLMTENQSASSHSFLLDDDSSIPFQLDDIQDVIGDKVGALPRCAQALPCLE